MKTSALERKPTCKASLGDLLLRQNMWSVLLRWKTWKQLRKPVYTLIWWGGICLTSPSPHYWDKKSCSLVCHWPTTRKTLWFYVDLGLNDPVFSGGEQALIDRTVIGRWDIKTYRVSIKVNVPATDGCFESSGTSWYSSAGLEQVCSAFIWYSVFKSVDWYGFVSGSLLS